MSKEKSTISVELLAKIDGFKDGLKQATATFNQTASQLKTTAHSISSPFAQIKKDIASIGSILQKEAENFKNFGASLSQYITLPISLIGASIVKTAGDFESSMNELKALTQTTGEAFEALEAKAKQIGRTTQFSASEASQAMTMLAKNGLQYNQILQGGIDATIALSAATKADLSTAADIATDAMLQFNLQASELPQVADIISAATVNSKLNINQFGLALANAGGVAGAMKVPLQDFATAISLTSSAFSSGGDAGTSFKTFLLRLNADTKPAKAAMNKLGLSFYNAQGQMLPLRQIAENLSQSLKGLSEQEKSQYLKDIFGDDAIRTAIMFADAGAAGFDKMAESMKKVSAAELAKIQMQGFNGAMKGLLSAFEAVQLAIADSGLLSFLTSLINSLTGFVQKLSQLNPNILKFTVAIAGIAAAIGPVLFTVGKLSTALPVLFATIKMGATAFVALGRAIALASAKLLLIAGIVGLAVGALVAIGVAVKSAYDSFEGFRKVVDNAITGVKKFWELTVKYTTMAFEAVMKALNWISDAFNKVFGKEKENQKAGNLIKEIGETAQSTEKKLDFTGAFAKNLQGLKEFASQGIDKLKNGLNDLLFVKDKVFNIDTNAPKPPKPDETTRKLDEDESIAKSKAKLQVSTFKLPTLKQDAQINVADQSNKIQEEAANKLKALVPLQVQALDTVKQAAMETDYQLALMLKRMADNIPTFNDFQKAIANTFAQMGKDVARKDKDLKDFAKSAVASIKRVISALIAEGVAGVVSKTLVSAGVTGPFAVALAGAAGAAASALFNTIIPKFAEGGLVYGKTLGMVGEYPNAAANPEVIAPLSKLQNILANSMQAINSEAIVQAIRNNPPTMVNIDSDGFAIYENRRLQAIQYVTNRFNWQNK